MRSNFRKLAKVPIKPANSQPSAPTNFQNYNPPSEKIGQSIQVPLRILITSCLLTGILLNATEQRGTVKVNGLPIPGAAVTAKMGEQTIATSTDEEGVYLFPNLAPGEWVVEVEMAGFTGAVKTITMGADTPPALDLDMKVGKARVVLAAAKPIVAPAPQPAADEAIKSFIYCSLEQ